MMHRISIAAIALLATITGAAAASGLAALSTWQNTEGSILTIDQITGNQFVGTYVNNARGFGCQGTPYQTVGTINGSEIVFSVLWNNASEDCNSITAWTGYYASGRITTDWNLVFIDQSTQLPAIMQGTDYFYPVVSTSSGAPPKKN